jgi:hypothetical protein
MKTNLIIVYLIGLLILSCEKDSKDDSKGAGFEIYRVDTTYLHNIHKDYSTLDLDTFILEDAPILRYEDLLKYDTAKHKLTIGISHDSLKIEVSDFDHNFGSMFMVTLDKEPIYCGWFVGGFWSMPCNWVYILEPIYESDSLEDDEVIISFHYNSDYWQKNPDPRLDPRIIERLSADGKIE